MKPTILFRLATASMIITIGGWDTAYAQACPANLASLSSQIADPKLLLRIYKPLDEIVAEAGSLSAAIAKTEARLADLEAGRAALAPDASERVKSVYDQAIAIGRARVSGLKCRLQSSN